MLIKLRSFFLNTLKRPSCFIMLLLTLSLVTHAQSKKDTATLNTGIASWYSDDFNGRRTASGEIFNQKKFTCASNRYKLGTWLRVTNLRNGKKVVVKVNDRMSPRMRRIVDLSRIAAKELGIIGVGLVKVSVEKIKHKQP